MRTSDKETCRAQTAYFSNARAIIEAEQNIFRDILINISIIVGLSRLTSCILFT